MAKTFYTTENIDHIEKEINELLGPYGLRFMWSSRNGYYCIDYKKYDEKQECEIHDTLETGLTKREVYQIYKGIRFSAELLDGALDKKAQEVIGVYLTSL